LILSKTDCDLSLELLSELDDDDDDEEELVLDVGEEMTSTGKLLGPAALFAVRRW
jgi:hypothetical protein